MPEEPPVVEKTVEKENLDEVAYKLGCGCLFIAIAVLVGLFLLGGGILGWGL